MKSSILGVLLVATLLLAPVAHADTGVVPIGDPATDTLQLWSSIAASIELIAQDAESAAGQVTSAVQHLASAVTAPHPQPNGSHPHTPKQLSSAIAQAASVGAATLLDTATTSESEQSNLTAPQHPQSRSPPEATSNSITIDPQSAPAQSTSTFVTQNQFNAGMSALNQSLRQLIADSNSDPIISGPGAPLGVEEFAPSQAINVLTETTINNPTLTGGSIANAAISGGTISGTTLSGVSLSAGASSLATTTITGGLSLTGGATFDSATSTNFFSTNASTTNATSTNLFAAVSDFTTGLINTLSGTQLTYVAASTTNLVATNATSTNLAVTGVASTSNLVASTGFIFENVTGFLKATAGAVGTSLVNLASDVTGTLPAGNGGTGWSNVASGAILYGNGTNALATTSAGTAGYVLAYLNGVPTWTATTTLSNISGTLAVSSGGTGANTFGQGWIYSNGGTGALAASTSPTVNYITATSTTATSTFAGNISVGGNLNFNGTLLQNGLPFAGSQWTTSGSNIYYTAGNVGIGTTSPAAPLELFGSNSSTNLVTGGGIFEAITNGDQTAGNFDSLSYREVNSAGAEVTGTRISGVFNSHVAGAESADLAFLTRSAGVLSEKLRITGAGNVGIGTSSPLTKLTVQGTAGPNDLLNIASSTGGSLLYLSAAGNVGIGTASPSALLSLQGQSGQTANFLSVASSSSSIPPLFNIDTSGVTYLRGNAVEPTFVSGTAGTSLADPRDIAIVGDYAYIVDANDNAFDVFDISNPTNPVEIARAQGAVPGTSLPKPYGLAIQGRYAYVVGPEGSGTQGQLSVIDISNPRNPIIVGSTQGPAPGTTLNRVEAVVVSGEYAYVANRNRNSVTTFNISDPANPTFVTESVGTIPGTTGTGPGPSALAIDGSYLYVGTTAGQFAVFDISNPANPTYLSETTGISGGPAFGVIKIIKVQGKYAYAIDNNPSNPALAIIDISDPSNPTVVSEFQAPGSTFSGIQGLWISGKYAYITSDVAYTLSVLDVSSSTNPTLVYQIPSNATELGGAQKIVVSGRYAYIINSVFQSNGSPYGLTVWDLGSAQVTNLEAGTIKTTNLRVEGPTWLDQSLNVNDDLLVGGNSFINGALSIYGMGSTSVAHANALTVNGDVLVNNSAGIQRYFNFGTVDGSSGYGIEDNAGTLEFKNSTGAWAPIGTGTTTGVAVSYTKSLDLNASQVVDSNSAAATTVYSYTVPAGTLGSSGVLRISVNGTYLNNSGSSRTITLSLVYGGATCVSKASGSLATSATIGGWNAVFYLAATSTTAQSCTFNAGASTGATALSWGGGGLVSVNSAVAQTLTIQATNSAAATTITLTKESAETELLNATGTFGSQWTTSGSSISYTGGNVGIGTTNPYSRLQVSGPDTASTSAFAVVNSASTTVFAVYDNGNATYSGSIFQSSDQRLKTDIQSLDGSSSLSSLLALNPVSYTRIDQPGQGENLGFIAQQVADIFPELVSTTSPTALTPDGTLTLNYVGLIAPIVNAIRALSTELTSIENTIAGFAQSITSAVGNFGQLNTNELCVGSTCVTPAQFQAMVAAANISQPSEQWSSAAPSSGASTTPDTPPVILINGNNPAIVDVGDTYNDLGAMITGPQADLNFGITTYVDGALMNAIQIDTSAAATDTIDYVATDKNGLTSTSTRVVIVEASPSIAADDASTTATTTAQ